ncbi:iron ABC transporter permease [Nesterenkonia sp. F]|uniref:FecCD family ABC transporter permease n=1 Tax=Nesterenkonia sp. F TaxID=795955 RepID=UPI000255C98C|nr:iron chelate uptake ABC transporter family permease subunit [Nesterenkonia sp. F]
MTAPLPAAPARTAPLRRALGARRAVVLVAGVLILLGLLVAGLFVGSGDISAARTVDVLARAPQLLGADAQDRTTTEVILVERRLPRTLLAVVVGAALGISGALMQALTRNPLADPGLLGVNAGAYTAVVFGSATLGLTIGGAHVWLAMGGALVTAVLVHVVGSSGTAGRGGGGPARLVLTGVAVGAVLSGVSHGVTLVMPEVFDRVRFWSSGSLQGRTFDDLSAVAPFILVGLLVALSLPRALNALALGDDAAVALGSRPGTVRLVGLLAITLLCGAATAVAGPMSFIGLIVPHALRMLIGPDHRWLLRMSVLAAPILMLGADLLGRVATASELPTGVVTAALGAPVLIALTRRRTVRSL